MSSSLGTEERHSRAKSVPYRIQHTDSEPSRRQWPRRGSAASLSSTPGWTDCMTSPSNPDIYPRRAQEEMVITSIRATDVALGLRPLPAGFYTAVRHSDHEWRTENKRSSVNHDVVEWTGPIPIPRDPSAVVNLEVYASFEFQPMLGAGEQLRKLTVTVKQLLDQSAGDAPFTFFPNERDVVSPCSSISVTVERSMSSTSRVLLPHNSSAGELEDTTNEGHSAFSRYRKRGERRDLELSIAKFEQALSICPPEHPCRAAAESNLAIVKFVFCQVADASASLETPLNLYRDALRKRPTGHMDRPSTLIRLAAVSFARCDKSKNKTEEARCEGLLHEALELTSAESHENRVARIMLQLCAVRCMETSTLRDAVQLTPDDHPSMPRCLNSLGNSLLARFRCLGELYDLDGAVSTYRDAVRLTPDNHPDKPSYLANLGISIFTRFERLGKLRDLDDMISTHWNAFQLTPVDHPQKPCRLGNLGVSLCARFTRLGELRDLDDAISTHMDVVQLTPEGHPDKSCGLANLGNFFLIRFWHLGELCDLDAAMSIHRDTVELTPSGHPDKPSRLKNLGGSLLTRFGRLGELPDLDAAILTLRDAVRLTPDDNPDKPGCLNNLAVSLSDRFSHLGELRDLDAAILLHRDAIQLTPGGHPDKPHRLSNLGSSLYARFQHFGKLRDLDEAISCHRDAVQLIPDGHPDKPRPLSDLGDTLRMRFESFGELRDLDDAVSAHWDAVQLTPGSHPLKPCYLSSLGISLFLRFKRLGELYDLDNAISSHRDAVRLTPHDHPHRPGHLSCLGVSFRARFERIRELCDLGDAILTHRDAVQLTPHGHPAKPGRLSSFGLSLLSRFSCLGKLCDLDDAISIHMDAVQLTPDGHPDKSRLLILLGACLLARFRWFRELRDMEGVLSAFSNAAVTPVGPVHTRFAASQCWILCASCMHHHSFLRAYSVAVNLLPQLAWIGLSLEHRYSKLTQNADVVWEAAAAALDADLPELAVEWLEQGRSIVWGALFQLRSSYEELASVHPDHARRLQELSVALERASATHEKSLAVLSTGMASTMEYEPEQLRQKADRHRSLAIERDELLQEICKLPGFDGFLRYKQFSKLRASAHAGPAVMLNAAKSRCDALIVVANVDHVIHVPLPDFTLLQSALLQITLRGLVREEREGHRVKGECPGWEAILPPLWKCVVKPVLDALAFSIPGDPSRIFWCPTGPFAFLPLHAAGLYDDRFSQPGHRVFDFVVSSYTPSLAILSPSLNQTATHNDSLCLLTVRQPPTDGQGQLPGVVTELARIREVIEYSPSVHTLVEPSVGTVEEVLSLMKDADWVHFACHGVQDGINSGLCLADGRRLKVRDMITLSRPRGGLAFLSACQTAKGEKRLSDEAIHITAGMLFTGYGGVIGTMWSISDKLAPDVARDVYEHLFRKGAQPDYREAAYALHKAIGNLRDSDGVSFDEWIPFIHVGL